MTKGPGCHWLTVECRWRAPGVGSTPACTTHNVRLTLTLTMGDGPHVIHGYLNPPQPTRQTSSRSSQLSLQASHAIISILYYGTGPFPPQNCPLLLEGSGPPSNTWLRRPTPPHMPYGISIGPAVLPQYIRVTNTHTPTMNIAKNR